MKCLVRAAAALTLGLLISVGLAWWLTLRPQTTYTMNHRVGVNSAPDGQPGFRSNFGLADEYRPGYRRIAITADAEPIDALVTQRILADLAANDRTPHYPNGGPSQTPQRPFWPTWVPQPSAGGPAYRETSGRAAGWPWPCLHSTRTQTTDQSAPRSSGSLRLLESTQYTTRGSYSSDPERGSVPLLPIWPGLIGNTVIFAAPWALLFFGAPALRATIRRRRGRCVRCGYPRTSLASSTPCPECGHTTHP